MADKEAKDPKDSQAKSSPAKEAEAKKPAAAPATPETPAEGAEKKSIRKVSAMTLKEIDDRLKEVEQKMGGFQSRYAHQLLVKKAELSGQKTA